MEGGAERQRGRRGGAGEREPRGERGDGVSDATPRGRPGETVRRGTGGAGVLRFFFRRRCSVDVSPGRASRETSARVARRRDSRRAGRAESSSHRQIFTKRRAASGVGGDAGSDRRARPDRRAARRERRQRERARRETHVSRANPGAQTSARMACDAGRFDHERKRTKTNFSPAHRLKNFPLMNNRPSDARAALMRVHPTCSCQSPRLFVTTHTNALRAFSPSSLRPPLHLPHGRDGD